MISKNPKIVALIPALNEGRTIENLVRRTLKYVDHVVVVDDLSEDDTVDIARRAGAQVIRLSKRRRVGGVVKAGISYVKKLKPYVVVTLDADGQHDPDEIPNLLKLVLNGKFDLVQGSRFLFDRHKRTVRDAGNCIFSRFVSILLRQKITDITSGFRVFNFIALSDLDLKFDQECYPEMTIDLSLKGYRIGETPIKNLPRLHGNSKVIENLFTYIFKALGIITYTFLRNLKNKNARMPRCILIN